MNLNLNQRLPQIFMDAKTLVQPKVGIGVYIIKVTYIILTINFKINLGGLAKMDSFERQLLKIKVLQFALKSEFDLTPGMIAEKLNTTQMTAMGLLVELTCNDGLFKLKQKNSGWVRYFEPDKDKIIRALANKEKLLEVRYSE